MGKGNAWAGRSGGGGRGLPCLIGRNLSGVHRLEGPIAISTSIYIIYQPLALSHQVSEKQQLCSHNPGKLRSCDWVGFLGEGKMGDPKHFVGCSSSVCFLYVSTKKMG